MSLDIRGWLEIQWEDGKWRKQTDIPDVRNYSMFSLLCGSGHRGTYGMSPTEITALAQLPHTVGIPEDASHGSLAILHEEHSSRQSDVFVISNETLLDYENWGSVVVPVSDGTTRYVRELVREFYLWNLEGIQSYPARLITFLY